MHTATYDNVISALELVSETGDEEAAFAVIERASAATVRKVVKLYGVDSIEYVVGEHFNEWADNRDEEEEAAATAEDVAAAVKRTDRGMHKVAAAALALAPKSEVRRMHRSELERLLNGHADRDAVISALAAAETEVTARRQARA